MPSSVRLSGERPGSASADRASCLFPGAQRHCKRLAAPGPSRPTPAPGWRLTRGRSAPPRVASHLPHARRLVTCRTRANPWPRPSACTTRDRLSRPPGSAHTRERCSRAIHSLACARACPRASGRYDPSLGRSVRIGVALAGTCALSGAALRARSRPRSGARRAHPPASAGRPRGCKGSRARPLARSNVRVRVASAGETFACRDPLHALGRLARAGVCMHAHAYRERSPSCKMRPRAAIARSPLSRSREEKFSKIFSKKGSAGRRAGP